MADLEASAHPALDALSHHVTIVNLERVRRIKSRMTRLKVRGSCTHMHITAGAGWMQASPITATFWQLSLLRRRGWRASGRSWSGT